MSRPLNVQQWLPEHVAAWLREIGFRHHADRFRQEAIAGEELVALTADELRSDLGVSALGERKRLLNRIRTLKDPGSSRAHDRAPDVVPDGLLGKDQHTTGGTGSPTTSTPIPQLPPGPEMAVSHGRSPEDVKNANPEAQGPQGEPARGAGGARPWDRDWGTVPDPLGDEALPLVGDVYGWLSWANQGTTRGMRNRPFDAVLLRRDGGNREVPPGGWAAPEDHERVLRSVIRAAWPDRGPTWPAFLEGGAVPRITDADANNWLPRALRSALAHWRYRRRNPPPPQPQPSHKRRRR